MERKTLFAQQVEELAKKIQGYNGMRLDERGWREYRKLKKEYHLAVRLLSLKPEEREVFTPN